MAFLPRRWPNQSKTFFFFLVFGDNFVWWIKVAILVTPWACVIELGCMLKYTEIDRRALLQSYDCIFLSKIWQHRNYIWQSSCKQLFNYSLRLNYLSRLKSTPTAMIENDRPRVWSLKTSMCHTCCPEVVW